MSHVKEIKQKQELQAKFQLAINSTTNHVANWLTPLKSNVSQITETSNSNNDFFDLPIISGGSGLSLSKDDIDEENINTIGEYIKSGKSISSLNKKKQQQQKSINGSMYKIQKTDSKALGALRNKMKNGNRLKQRDSLQNQYQRTGQRQGSIKNGGGGAAAANNGNNDNDSDSDEEIVQKSAPKKNFSLLIDSKIKKRK